MATTSTTVIREATPIPLHDLLDIDAILHEAKQKLLHESVSLHAHPHHCEQQAKLCFMNAIVTGLVDKGYNAVVVTGTHRVQGKFYNQGEVHFLHQVFKVYWAGSQQRFCVEKFWDASSSSQDGDDENNHPDVQPHHHIDWEFGSVGPWLQWSTAKKKVNVDAVHDVTYTTITSSSVVLEFLDYWDPDKMGNKNEVRHGPYPERAWLDKGTFVEMDRQHHITAVH
jgi:hypothetical protein